MNTVKTSEYSAKWFTSVLCAFQKENRLFDVEEEEQGPEIVAAVVQV
jgi:hypothetical protein